MAIKESVGSSSRRLRLKEQDISGARVPATYLSSRGAAGSRRREERSARGSAE